MCRAQDSFPLTSRNSKKITQCLLEQVLKRDEKVKDEDRKNTSHVQAMARPEESISPHKVAAAIRLFPVTFLAQSNTNVVLLASILLMLKQMKVWISWDAVKDGSGLRETKTFQRPMDVRGDWRHGFTVETGGQQCTLLYQNTAASTLLYVYSNMECKRDQSTLLQTKCQASYSKQCTRPLYLGGDASGAPLYTPHYSSPRL